jgi:putative ABC transport system permease protein
MDIKPIYSALMRNKSGLALIVLQVAITLAVVCNSLFIILQRAERVGRPSGMDEMNTFVISSLGFAPNYDLSGALRQDLDAIRSLPGVVAATSTNTIPTSNGGWGAGFDTQPIDPNGERRAQSAALYIVDEAAVDAYGVKLIEGRDLQASDVSEFTQESGLQARSIIVTEALAKALYPDESAVGKPIYGLRSDTETSIIVGVVEKLQQPWVGSRFVEQSAFIPTRMLGNEGYSRYLVRTEPGQRDRLMREVEEKLQAINAGRIVRDLESVQSIREDSYRADQAMMSILMAVMVALVLVTGAGIVGLASFWVTRRIKQIGTRRALGARRFNIRAYFQTENGIMVGMGIALGIFLTYGFNLWLMQEYQAPRLPWFYLPIGALAVFVLGQVAVLGPAGRAAKVPPAVATRTA